MATTATTRRSVEARSSRRSRASAPTPTEVTPRARRFEELDIDSLDLVELAQIVEEEFGVELKGDDVEEIKTVGDAIDLVAGAAAQMTRRRVVITGVGAVTPLGVGARDALRALGRRRVRHRATARAPARSSIPTDHLSRKEARRADRFTQLALAASDEALADAGWADGLPYEPDRDRLRHRHRHRRHRRRSRSSTTRCATAGPKRVSPLAVPLMMGNAGAGRVAMRHGLRGPTFGVVSACAAGAHAIGAAMRADPVRRRRRGRHRRRRGGADAALARRLRGRWTRSRRAGSRGPFDARRDGFVMGEGAGVLVLEDARAPPTRAARAILGERARLRRDRRRPPPDRARAATARARAAAIRLALADAGCGAERRRLRQRPRHLDAAQRPRRDAARSRRARRARARSVPVSSTKSAIGHLLGAAGAVEAIATILALRERVVAADARAEEPDPELDLDYVPGTARR